ncbi:acyltransferase [Curtobacterium flaccumfaciens pv. flaccumfaciens]|uniref:acyltransferase family protein n=1 Tax=Curtobacterium flaccumfaciens TaxID=2035 RepID=UPI001ADD2F5E|nr:acyltransferase family protein [Curtobacterium flaccumfaciens]MBO9046866.1 acyltransferase [Curtobacterium flaccumfaciens pv. flaccumfaciens]MBO9058065.1 acyltransferase [Curtobacterium flaccumfaciens pv. flaccumfaciens]QTR91727.1 acyltransferase [Curtobacterium flaccumfaciens pv. flaccumfaciens]QVG67031.1 acyltransferase [Curtobacterium flaccumfaciens pv. flaccumfaciens]
MQTRSFRPDIQGLRGIAVAVVVLDHAFRWPSGGFLGVDVFFVISGFVITAGLLREHGRTGRIRLRAFAARRVRRLAPASLLVILVTTAAAWVLLPASRFASVAADAVASVLAVQNWRLAAAGTDYFAATAAASPFQHFWSLAVEEQFYLVLPVLLLLLLGRRARRDDRTVGHSARATVVIGGLTVCSLAWAFVAAAVDPASAYFSTATRAWELGVGVLTAIAVHRAPSLRPWVAECMVVIGLGAIAASVLIGRETLGMPAPLGLVPTLGTALILVAGAGSGSGSGSGSTRTAAPLRWRPLVGLGTVSYSLYLWHWPFIVLLPLFTSLPVGVVVVLALLTSIASYATVETAFRHRGLRTTLHENRLRLQVGALAALTVLTLVTVSGTAERLRPLPPVPAAAPATAEDADPTDDDSFPALQARADDIAAGLSARSWPDDLSPSAEAISAPGYADSLTKTSSWAPTLGCSEIGADWRADSCTWGATSGTSVMLTGDSTGAFSAPGWRALAEDPDAGVQVRNAAQIGCPFSTTALTSDVDTCAAHNAEVLAELERTTPDVLVVTNRFWDKEDPSLDGITRESYESGVKGIIEAARPHVGRVVIAPATPPGYAPTGCVAGTRGPQDCREGDATARAQMRSLSALLDDVEATTVLDTTPLWCSFGTCPLLIGNVLTRFDPVHVTPEASQASAPALLDLLRKEDILPRVRPSTP